jgi:hypothetical protein
MLWRATERGFILLPDSDKAGVSGPVLVTEKLARMAHDSTRRKPVPAGDAHAPRTSSF